MKQTRHFTIKQRIFKLADFKRIADVFDEQAKLAIKSDHHYSVAYKLYFADGTSFESDSPSVLEDPVVEIKRPVIVEFSYCNYRLDRHISFSVAHGNSGYRNAFWIKATEPSWLNDNFTKLETFVNGAEPQSFWFSRHPYVLLNLLALGVGSFTILLLFTTIDLLLDPSQISFGPSIESRLQVIAAFLKKHTIFAYFIFWAWKWVSGLFLGAVPIANWLLLSWPDINLDFGAEHLKSEKRRREKIFAVMTIIIVPVVLSIIQDIFYKTN